MGKWVSEQASKDAESRQVVEGVDEKELSLSDESSKDFVDTQLLDKAEGVATQVAYAENGVRLYRNADIKFEGYIHSR